MTWLSCLLGIASWGPVLAASPSHTFALSAVKAVYRAAGRAENLPVNSALPKVKAKSLGDQTPCSLNVVNEDPAKILQVLSAQTETNLMLLSATDKKLTLNLRDVKLIDMIRHICALTGLSHLKIGETHVLATSDSLKSAYPLEWEEKNPTAIPIPPPAAPPIVSSTVMLNHISSSQIVPILEKFFDKQVLVVVAGPVQVTPSVTATDTGKTTGTESTVLGKNDSDPAMTAKMLILRGPEPMVRDAEKLARQLDVVRPQVVIEVTIWDINDSALKEVGASWNFGSTAIEESNPNGLNFGSFQRTGLSFSATLKALEKKDQAKILASPNISVLDGERAFILIGDRINFPVLVGYTQAGSPIFSKEEERVGIYLQVAASVASDGSITMSLYPQVSTVTGFLEVNGASYPQISTREAQSTLRIKSGETLIMGGLMKSEEIVQLEKVPLLGDIPFLGELFKRRKVNKSSSQVLISIKPTVLRGDESR